MSSRREFPIARSKLTQGLVLSGVLAAIGLTIILLAGDAIQQGWLVGAVNLVAAAAIAVAAFRNANDRQPRLVMDENGIWFRDWNLPRVPWSHIQGAYTGGSRLSPFIQINLHRPETFFSSLPQGDRPKANSNRLVRSDSLRIPHGSVEAELQEMVSEIRARAG